MVRCFPYRIYVIVVLAIFFKKDVFNMGKVFEGLRIVLSGAGFFMAYYQRPDLSLFWMVALVVLPLTLFSGIEGMFFMASLLVGKDWVKQPCRFEIQSRMHFIAIAITAIIVLLCNMNIQAQLTLCIVAFTFFFMSSINHLSSYIFDNASKIHLERFILTVLLWVFFIPLVVRSYPYF